ncbi:glycosyltransferase [Vibrio breoganii]
MKVLWITPNLTPEFSKELKLEKQPSGSWLGTLSRNLVEKYNVDLHILVLGQKNLDYTKEIAGITYHYRNSSGSVFKDNPKIKKLLAEIVSEIEPELIDLQGIEFHYCKYLSSEDYDVPIVSTIQGLTSEIYKYTTGGLSFYQQVKNRTLKDWLFFDGLYERKYRYYKRGMSETETIKKNKYFIGRTFWDKSKIFSLNSNAKYYHCEHEIRKEFYGRCWDYDDVEPQTIFMSQANTAFKGLHVLLKAVFLVKKKFPNTKLKIAGINPINNSTILDKMKRGTYSSFIENEISRLGLGGSIEFLGVLDGDKMSLELSKSNCYILPSLIENSPVSLSEAQLIGTPVISSFVGGCPESVSHNFDGYLYNSMEPESLAYYISDLFSNKEKCEFLSINAKNNALNKFKNTDATRRAYDIYIDIIDDFQKLKH